MTKINRNLLKFGIVFVAMVDAGTSATSPALGTIMAAMPHVAPSLIQSIATVPSIFLALAPLAYFKLVDYGMRKRTLLYLGTFFFIVGGVAPYFLHSNIWVILSFRALLGIGNGICMPLAADLVIDFFEGHQRNTMQGFVSAFTGISGVVFQLLGGFLAGISWPDTFLAYVIAVIFLGTAIAILPEPDRKGKIVAKEGIADVKDRARLTGSTYLVAILFGFFFIFFIVCPTNSAMVLIKEKMAVPAQIGAIFSMLTVGQVVVSLSFGLLFKKLRFTMFPIAYLLGAIALYIMYIAHNIPLYTVGITILGVAVGSCVPTTITKITGLLPYSAGAAGISIVYFALGVGQFVQPFAFQMFGPAGIGRPAFLIGAVGFVTSGVLMTVIDRMTPTKYVSTENIPA